MNDAPEYEDKIQQITEKDGSTGITEKWLVSELEKILALTEITEEQQALLDASDIAAEMARLIIPVAIDCSWVTKDGRWFAAVTFTSESGVVKQAFVGVDRLHHIAEKQKKDNPKVKCPAHKLARSAARYRDESAKEKGVARVEIGRSHGVSQIPKMMDWGFSALNLAQTPPISGSATIIDDKAEGLQLGIVGKTSFAVNSPTRTRGDFDARLVQPGSAVPWDNDRKFEGIEVRGEIANDIISDMLAGKWIDSRTYTLIDVERLAALCLSIQDPLIISQSDILRFLVRNPKTNVTRHIQSNLGRGVRAITTLRNLGYFDHELQMVRWPIVVDDSRRKDEFGHGLYIIKRAGWYESIIDAKDNAVRYTSTLFCQDEPVKGSAHSLTPIVQRNITTAERIINHSGGLLRLPGKFNKHSPQYVPVMLHPANSNNELAFSVEDWARITGIRYDESVAKGNNKSYTKIRRGIERTIEYTRQVNSTCSFRWVNWSDRPIRVKATKVYREIVSKPKSDIMSTIVVDELLDLIEKRSDEAKKICD